MHCSAQTGYTYNTNIYAGKQSNPNKGANLGERVVRKLVSTFKNEYVTVAFDKFFTSVHLIDTIDFPAFETRIKTQKDLPQFSEKLACGK